jgi:hypothetical protein
MFIFFLRVSHFNADDSDAHALLCFIVLYLDFARFVLIALH